MFIYKIRIPSLLPYLQQSNFGVTSSHPWRSLIGLRYPQGNFGIFLETFNNEINLKTYSFFFAIAHNIYYFCKYNTTDRKAHRLSPCRKFFEKLKYLQCLIYRITNQLKKVNSVIESKQLLEKYMYTLQYISISWKKKDLLL